VEIARLKRMEREYRGRGGLKRGYRGMGGWDGVERYGSM